MSAVGAFTVTKENIEDDRALLKTGVIGTGTEVEKQPILDRYIPAHPVDRYTFKKWSTDDWSRHNENKYFQSEQDRGQVGGHWQTIFGEMSKWRDPRFVLRKYQKCIIVFFRFI